MAAFNTAEWLTAWECCLSQSSQRRIVTLLATGYPELSEPQLLSLPIGQRDGLALRLREMLFGPQLSSLATCPRCSESLELALDVADIKIDADPVTQGPLTLEQEVFRLAFRLPNSQDLMRIEVLTDLANARNALFERCLLTVERDGQPCSVQQLPEQILDQVEATMAIADPQADVKLDLSCPACQHHWLAAFDIGSFLWREINAWAQRVLNEVHLLARAYCWHEADILAMSQLRRQFYLERVT